MGGHRYSSLLVCLLPEAHVGVHGYNSSRLVCLFVICESAYLDGIAVRLQLLWITFTQQDLVISFNSGRF